MRFILVFRFLIVWRPADKCQGESELDRIPTDGRTNWVISTTQVVSPHHFVLINELYVCLRYYKSSSRSGEKPTTSFPCMSSHQWNFYCASSVLVFYPCRRRHIVLVFQNQGYWISWLSSYYTEVVISIIENQVISIDSWIIVLSPTCAGSWCHRFGAVLIRFHLIRAIVTSTCRLGIL